MADASFPLMPASGPGILRRSLRWAAHGMFVALAAFAAWTFCVPGGYLWLCPIAFVAWVLAGLMWAALLTAYNFQRMRSPSSTARVRWTAWIVAPALASMTLTAIALDLPLQLRFDLSRGALERAAREVMARPDSANTDSDTLEAERIGLFDVWCREQIPGGASLMIDGAGGFLEPGGFAYLPDGARPPEQHAQTYTSFADDWYVVFWDD